MKEYLSVWNYRFKDKQALIQTKIINENIARAIFKRIGLKLNDIGIFGDVYGIQSINDMKDEKFYTDELKINFYFDKVQTENQIKSFKELLAKSELLDSVL